MVKPPTALGRGSCTHALRISDAWLPGAMKTLHQTSLHPQDVYIQSAGGGYREVVW